MLNFDFAKMKAVVVHGIGNKLNDENVMISDDLIDFGICNHDHLLPFYVKNFKSEMYYQFKHDGGDIRLNLIYSAVESILSWNFNKLDFIDYSENFARHLYDVSNHPKIRSGELHVVFFEGVMCDGEQCDAIGIFKTDTREMCYDFDLFAGLSKANAFRYYTAISKGAIILNLHKDSGYKVAVYENNTKDNGYWINEFLMLNLFENDYLHTRNLLNMCKNFVFEYLPTKFEVEAKDQAGILNKIQGFVKDDLNYESEAFANDVFEQPEIIEEFKNFKSFYEEINEVTIPDTFDLNDVAVKQVSKSFKRVLKLDKNFHIYLHGDNKLIEKGKDDELGMNYYKLYFKNEQ